MSWQLFKDKLFISVILFSIILHLFLASLPGLTFDMQYWFNWSERLQQVGFSNFYSPIERTDYLPGYLYVLYFFGFIKNYFQLPDNIYLYLLKLPGIFSEVLLSIVVYSLLYKLKGLKTARLSLFFIALNPALILNSAVWGQIDSMLTLVLLLTVISFNANKSLLTAIFFGLSLVIKPQALSILPAFLLTLTSRPKALYLLKIFPISILIAFLLFIPFFDSHIIARLLNYSQTTANEYPYNSLSAYNLWGALGSWIPDNQQILGITYYHWGIFFFMVFWSVVFYLHLKKRYNLYTLTTLATLSFYFLPTRVHERYLYPALVFLFISCFLRRNKTLLVLAIVLNFLHFTNLLHVYLRYDGYLLTFAQYLTPLYQFLEKNITILSLISTALFFSIAVTLLKIDHDKKSFHP